MNAEIIIISGGQTGADRAALDFAIEHGIPHGGWCPKGRRAEDGAIKQKYQLKETGSKNYLVRTHLNIQESDASRKVRDEADTGWAGFSACPSTHVRRKMRHEADAFAP